MKRVPLTMLKAVGDSNYGNMVKDWNDQNPEDSSKPSDRVNGNEVIRRYPNGLVDIHTTAEKVVYFCSHIKTGMVPMNHSDLALVVLVLPKTYGHLMDTSMAKTYCRRVADEDLRKIREVVKNSFPDGDTIKD